MQSAKISVQDFSLYYGAFHALKKISLGFPPRSLTALVGPSGCGKSTLLRSLNRMNDLIAGVRVEGRVSLEGSNIYDPDVDVVPLRKKVGMVFQRPNPFPMSIFENIAYGPRVHGEKKRSRLQDIVEQSLKSAALWDEVKDRLDSPALKLSGGQQQRLCIARLLAVEPEVLLMDEPCSALDPIATEKVEELVMDLKKKYTIVVVTHNIAQAARISDYLAFFYLGEMIESGVTRQLLTNPTKHQTEDYLTGRFG
ncbi:MAG TPA: phosphate ABC transporter ATP-binding protein [Firmicutes bacterium]|nr:phosphate ABC transporter ATP-binding protein [Bacillota bacterium]